MEVVRIEALPEAALDAAARFHAEWLPGLRGRPDDLLLAFPPAGHDQRAWRLAAVQDLARAAVPHRVNAIDGQSAEAIAAARALLDDCQGITGQYLALDPDRVLLQSA